MTYVKRLFYNSPGQFFIIINNNGAEYMYHDVLSVSVPLWFDFHYFKVATVTPMPPSSIVPLLNFFTNGWSVICSWIALRNNPLPTP
jgi:hypothetical protein